MNFVQPSSNRSRNVWVHTGRGTKATIFKLDWSRIHWQTSIRRPSHLLAWGQGGLFHVHLPDVRPEIFTRVKAWLDWAEGATLCDSPRFLLALYIAAGRFGVKSLQDDILDTMSSEEYICAPMNDMFPHAFKLLDTACTNNYKGGCRELTELSLIVGLAQAIGSIAAPWQLDIILGHWYSFCPDFHIAILRSLNSRVLPIFLFKLGCSYPRLYGAYTHVV
ncbi:hypothetical protein TWF481_003154 [Arthrobotrys musiformis]|uniref:Uncharacterized protein n=1 Tax=Arthrobotrys musiformis TaxID=47236 RepID=A0AAV9VS03_9PEZI